MKHLISIIVLSLVLTSCGFKPIYNSKNSNFEIIEIENKNKNKNSFFIEKTVTSYSNKDAKNKFKIEIDYKQLILKQKRIRIPSQFPLVHGQVIQHLLHKDLMQMVLI